MDYEKKYKEAIERAKQLLRTSATFDRFTIARIFPELEKSEDERIRKALIENFKFFAGDHLETSKWGKDDGLLVTDILTWLEKQGGQEPLDYENVKSKFKVGDWIISNNKKSIYQVIEVKRGIYVIRDNADNHEYHIGIEECEKSGRLWTIQDAKDGDVLYCKSDCGIEYIVMSKGVNNHNNIDSYFRCNSVDGFGIDIPNVLNTKQDYITPATKELRDLLFKKMKEAGYEWDAEKKELKNMLLYRN